MKLPDSLISLDHNLLDQILLSDQEIMDLKWFLFRVRGCDSIFLDQSELEKAVNGLVDGPNPYQCNIQMSDFVAEVPNSLKRFSEENGFYSA